jgi:hypothetical protein
MTENIDPQLKALMEVINAITANPPPMYEMHELTSKSALRNLQYLIDDCNALDDSDMIDTLNQTRIEIKYLASVVSDLRERLKETETERTRLENLVHRAN